MQPGCTYQPGFYFLYLLCRRLGFFTLLLESSRIFCRLVIQIFLSLFATMTVQEAISKVQTERQSLKEKKGIDIPVSIQAYPELKVASFDAFLKKVDNKEYSLHIPPNGKMSVAFSTIAPRKEKMLKDILMYIPFLLSIAVLFWGFLSDMNVLLAALLVPFFSQYICTTKAAVIAPFLSLLFLGVSLYLFSGNTGVSILLILIAISLIIHYMLRVYMKNTLYRLSKADELIFSFLYDAHALMVYDTVSKKYMIANQQV